MTAEVWDIARACMYHVDHGEGTPLTLDQATEAVAHPLAGIKRDQWPAVVAYLACQAVGARQSVNADGALAMAQVESIVADFQARKAAS